MSAEDLGKRLLGQVEVEGLDELLASLRVLHDPSSLPGLGVPQIDALIALFAAPHQPAQPVRRTDYSHLWDHDDLEVASDPRLKVKAKAQPIVEIASPGSKDGETQLLYYLATISILPVSLGDVPLNGQDAVVVVLDVETRFSVSRLVQVMKNHIHTRISTVGHEAEKANLETEPLVIPSSTEVGSLITEALKHVHIFRPQSLSSLIATITHLPDYLFNTKAHFSSTKRVTSILLDSASSFFWQDRADMETSALPLDLRGRGGGAVPPPQIKPQSQYVALASAIKRASSVLKCPVVYTIWNLSSGALHKGSTRLDGGNNNNNQGPALRSHLPAPWPSLPMLRLVIERRAVRKFPVGMTGEEAARQKQSRELAVRKGVYDVSVNRWGAEDWPPRLMEGLRREGSGFEVRITGQGVVFEEE